MSARTLGQDLEVSAIGLDCMGMSSSFPPSARASCSPRPDFPGEGLPELIVGARPSSPTTALVEQLTAIGARARFETRHTHLLVPHEKHIWFAGWHADYPDPDGFYLGLLEQGLPLYRDDAADAALAQARVSRDRDQRLRLYRECVRPNPMGAFHPGQVVIEPLPRGDS